MVNWQEHHGLSSALTPGEHTHFLGAGTMESCWRIRSILRGRWTLRFPFSALTGSASAHRNATNKTINTFSRLRSRNWIILEYANKPLPSFPALSVWPTSKKNKLSSGFSDSRPLKHQTWTRTFTTKPTKQTSRCSTRTVSKAKEKLHGCSERRYVSVGTP